MAEPRDPTWQALEQAAERLSKLSIDTVEVWPFRKRSLLRFSVAEGLDAGDNWVYGLAEPVRRRRLFGRDWRDLQTIEQAAGRIEAFLRERPDLRAGD